MRFFIASMANLATGGIELLHQFCRQLNDMGLEAYMLYLDAEKTKCPIHEDYYKYDVKYVTQYVDAKDSVLVIPETQVHLQKWCKLGIGMIWWLSVDNYIISYRKYMENNNVDLFELKKNKNIIHFVQSHYAKEFVEKALGIAETYYLMDYINDDIVEYAEKHKDTYERKNICVYNPKKGYENLQPIIAACREDIQWIPLTGLKPEEMAKIMCSARVYVDFGGHPGKDRIPREAALCGCCILTNREGSALYQYDVNIPVKYKIEDTRDIEGILEKIYDLVDNYEQRHEEFNTYVLGINQEKKRFMKDLYQAVHVLEEKVQKKTIVMKDDKERYEQLDKSTNDALDRIRQLLQESQRLYREGNMGQAIDKMLNSDYIMQMVRETIYAKMEDMAESM